MVQNVAPLMSELEGPDFHLLSGLEHGMRFSEWVDKRELPDLAGLGPDEVEFRLTRALKRELIEKRTLQYEGYRLTFEGYDALALWSFAKANTIDGVGAKLGVGKESDVYEASSFRPLALKFHREGIGNFRNLTRERDYTADREHVSDLYTARIAAEREHDLLSDLYPEVSVPRPIEQNRHAIVMELIEGPELAQASFSTDEANAVFIRILHEAAKAYHAGYVHADLSEYNVFVEADRVVLFDWPQAVEREHPNAAEFLERDVRTILEYFERKYPDGIAADVTVPRVLDAIRSDTVASSLELPEATD